MTRKDRHIDRLQRLLEDVQLAGDCHNLETDYSHSQELMTEGSSTAIPIGEMQYDPPSDGITAPKGINPTRGGAKPPGKRISVRIDHGLFRLLQTRCKEKSCDVSFVVREGLRAILEDGKEPLAQDEPGAQQISPQEVADRSVRYLSGSSNLLRETRNLFLELMGALTACVRGHPRTSGVREIYDGMLELSRYLKFGHSGRQG